MNGTYAPSVSWPYTGAEREAFEDKRKKDDGIPYWQDFDFEIDLLLEKPEDHVAEWVLAGASCLIVHVESTVKLKEIFDTCTAQRVETAIALKPSTDIKKLEECIDRALFVQVMGSDRIGYHGVTLDKKVLDTIRAIKSRWPQVTIGVDIGVNAETLPQLIEAGATRFVAGSAVFAYSAPSNAIAHLESIVSLHMKV
jgi:ribulose-phosphate 3-epimerase